MPRATEKLSKDSSPEAIKAAISTTIAELVRSGRTQEEAAAIAYREAREKTGEGLRKKGK